MARITVEDCLVEENNRFALVILAFRRAKQLLHGGTVLLKKPCDNKSIVTALREIAEGDVRFLTEQEAREVAERAIQRKEDLQIVSAVAEPLLDSPLAAPVVAVNQDDAVEDESAKRNGDSTF